MTQSEQNLPEAEVSEDAQDAPARKRPRPGERRLQIL